MYNQPPKVGAHSPVATCADGESDTRRAAGKSPRGGCDWVRLVAYTTVPDMTDAGAVQRKKRTPREMRDVRSFRTVGLR